MALSAGGPLYPDTASGLAATADGEFFGVDNDDGTASAYLNDAGDAVLQGTVIIDPSRPGMAAALNLVGLDGGSSIATNGGRMGITSEGTPLVPEALLQLVNRLNTTGLNVRNYLTSPFTNHDCLLCETYNDVQFDGTYLSWSGSFPNGYNNIAAGGTDWGERVGIYGWAVSVNIPGSYEHNGTLASQVGVRGRAGFRGDIHQSPATAVIQNAVGVHGDVVGESPLATIQNATGGKFTVPDTIASAVLNAVAVYAEAGAGSESNLSFLGAVGNLYNRDTAYFGPSSITGAQSGAAVSVRGDPANGIEFGNGDAPGYGCNIGATAPAGIPFIALHAEAEASGDKFRSRGLKPVVITSDLAGALVFNRIPTASGTGLSLVESGRFTDAGQFVASSSIRPASYTVATVPSAAAHGPGAVIYVADESGGAVLAFSDGATWLRCTDRTAIS